MYIPQSFRWSTIYVRSAEGNVRLNTSTFQLVFGWYVVVYILFTFKVLYTSWKNFYMTCF